jgi:hypothetical protein
MDPHIKLLLLVAGLAVFSGAAAIAWALGSLYITPIIAGAFFLIAGWRVAELEVLGRRLRWLFLLLAGFTLISLLLKLQ